MEFFLRPPSRSCAIARRADRSLAVVSYRRPSARIELYFRNIRDPYLRLKVGVFEGRSRPTRKDRLPGTLFASRGLPSHEEVPDALHPVA